MNLAEAEVTKLKELASTSDEAMAVFRALASYERPRPMQDLRRMRWKLLEEGIKLTDAAMVELFKKLQARGFGTLINKRNPDEPYRFKWKYNMVEVGRAGSGDKPLRPPAERLERKLALLSPDKLRIPFPLENGDVATIEIPKSLTKKEAQELADFIRRFGK